MMPDVAFHVIAMPCNNQIPYHREELLFRAQLLVLRAALGNVEGRKANVPHRSTSRDLGSTSSSGATGARSGLR